MESDLSGRGVHQLAPELRARCCVRTFHQQAFAPARGFWSDTCWGAAGRPTGGSQSLPAMDEMRRRELLLLSLLSPFLLLSAGTSADADSDRKCRQLDELMGVSRDGDRQE